MPTTAEYLNELVKQKKKLAQNLSEKGVNASETEKFNTLVDKVPLIDTLKGEEKTLQNIVNTIYTPTSAIRYNNAVGNRIVTAETKNKIPYPYDIKGTVTANNGLKVKINADGAINVSGTRTTENSEVMTLSSAVPVKKGIEYFLSGATEHTILQINLAAEIGIDVGGGAKVSFSADGEAVILFVVRGGTVGETVNETVLPQLEKGTEKTHFSTSVETPLINAYDKNIFDCFAFSAQEMTTEAVSPVITNAYGTTISTTDGTSNTITVTQSQTGNPASLIAYKNGYMNIGLKTILPSCKYTFSCNINITDNPLNATYLYLFNSNYRVGNLTKVSGNRWSVSFTTLPQITTSTLELRVAGCSLIMSNMQLELGNTLTEYTNFVAPTVYESGDIINITANTSLMTQKGAVIDGVYKSVTAKEHITVLPSQDKNAITKIYQPVVDSSVDVNIVPQTIRKGVTILGVTGTYEGETVANADVNYDESTKALTLTF